MRRWFEIDPAERRKAPADGLGQVRLDFFLRLLDQSVDIRIGSDSGETVEAVATRFGVSERHVRHRLRLGKLAPELLDAYRAGDISLDVVTAFTLGADHAAQLAVWHQLKGQSYIPPYTVRRLLTQAAIPVDSDLGLFVGSAAYEAAGGTVTRDPFTDDDEGFTDDATLVRRLAIEKLEQKAAELRSSWGWTRAMLYPAYDFTAQYRRVRPQPAELPAEIAGEIGLDRAAREAAAAWLPPGMAYADTAGNNSSADPQCDEAAPLAGEPSAAEPVEIDLQTAELPAFLTEDEPAARMLNGASAP